MISCLQRVKAICLVLLFRNAFPGSSITPESLFEYLEMAIVGREYGKFTFNKILSLSLEHIANLGKLVGLSRDQMSYVRYENLESLTTASSIKQVPARLREISEISATEHNSFKYVKFGHLLMKPSDLLVTSLRRATPNFVTNLRVEAEITFIESTSLGLEELRDKIVFIENADPGYDWIFY